MSSPAKQTANQPQPKKRANRRRNRKAKAAAAQSQPQRMQSDLTRHRGGPSVFDADRTRTLDPVLHEFEAQGVTEHAVLAITTPSEAHDYRWSSEFSEQPTATANPWSRANVGFPKGATLTGRPFDATEAFTVIRRNPLAAIIHYDSNPAGATFQYNWDMAYQSGTNMHNVGPDSQYQLEVGNLADVKFVKGIADTAYAPHGPTVFAAIDGESDRRYFWMNTPDTFSMTVTNDSLDGPADYTVGFYQYDESLGFEQLKEVELTGVASGGSASISNLQVLSGLPTDPGAYVAVSVKLKSMATSTVPQHQTSLSNVAVTGDNYCMCHLPIPHLEKNIGSVDAIRMIGIAGMFSNRASVLGLQGSVYGAQIAAGIPWTAFVGNLDKLTQASGSVEKDAAKGLYGYLRPTRLEDFTMSSDNFTVTNSEIVDSRWNIRNPGDYLIIYAKVNNTAESQNAFWSYFFNVEYRTTDVWRSISNARGDPVTVSRALSKVKELDQWYENPLHLKQLLQGARRLAKKAARGVIKHAPYYIDKGLDYTSRALGIAEAISKFI